MRVVRRFRQVLLAHRLPERMDDGTRDFAAQAVLAISELPGTPGVYSIFNLRWSMAQAHVTARAGDVVVLDTELKVLSPKDYEHLYEPLDETV